MAKKVQTSSKTERRRGRVRTIVSAHAHGSICLQQGRFVTEKEIKEKREALKDIKFA
jgi:hypothetical protein